MNPRRKAEWHPKCPGVVAGCRVHAHPVIAGTPSEPSAPAPSGWARCCRAHPARTASKTARSARVPNTALRFLNSTPRPNSCCE